jgi:hypothetical protein
MEMKCFECSESINESTDYCAFNAVGETICESCEHSHWDGAVRVGHYDPKSEDVTGYLYSYSLGQTRTSEDFEECDIPEPIESARWKSTDGWRGYVDVQYNNNFEVIANGWATGNYDDVKWKWDFNEFYENIHEGTLVPPVDVWFVFAQTSNVFSTAVDIVVHNHQAGTFLNWLADEAGMTRKQLEDALS